MPQVHAAVLFKEFHYLWEWELQSSPEMLWPLISDTNRFNHDAGVPAIERRAEAGVKLANARRGEWLARPRDQRVNPTGAAL